MQMLERLINARNSEKDARILRRLMMPVTFLNCGTFCAAGRQYMRQAHDCKMRGSPAAARKTYAGIRAALRQAAHGVQTQD